MFTQQFKMIILLLICFIIPLMLTAEPEDEKPRIAIMDFEGKNLSQEEADAVTDFLRTDLVNTKSFTSFYQVFTKLFRSIHV